MHDLSEHPFSPQSVAFEGGASGDREWYLWLREAERLIGHSLDGNDPDFEHGDGYSMDEAYNEWEAGKAPQAYVSDVKGRARYKRPE